MTLVYIPGHRIDDKMCMRRNNIQGLTKHIKINFPKQISNIVYPSEVLFCFGWVCFCSCIDELGTRRKVCMKLESFIHGKIMFFSKLCKIMPSGVWEPRRLRMQPWSSCFHLFPLPPFTIIHFYFSSKECHSVRHLEVEMKAVPHPTSASFLPLSFLPPSSLLPLLSFFLPLFFVLSQQGIWFPWTTSFSKAVFFTLSLLWDHSESSR